MAEGTLGQGQKDTYTDSQGKAADLSGGAPQGDTWVGGGYVSVQVGSWG